METLRVKTAVEAQVVALMVVVVVVHLHFLGDDSQAGGGGGSWSGGGIAGFPGQGYSGTGGAGNLPKCRNRQSFTLFKYNSAQTHVRWSRSNSQCQIGGYGGEL
ncbi:MAG: hypothetical protein IPJ13_07900 [Saprospiraceae bacterium]|nr:hypothetical protein [Saprospiraceae bacterium]